MQRRWLETVGCVVVLALVAGGLVGAVGADAVQDDEFPRAEAGLDQTVEQNASVLLDGSESFSPEGELVAYDWAIETPNGSTISPSCDSSDCRLARFRVPELGQYNVTLTVTDDDGRQMSDTLYVTVVPRGDFGVELTGPGTTGAEGNLTATVAPGDVAVHNVTWYRDDEPLGNRSLPAIGGTFNQSTFIAPGSTYRAVVNGSWNRTASDTWTAPGGASSTFVPDNSGEYPRIEGPAVVTGDPDRRGTVWRFDSTAYVLRTNQFGNARLSTWSVPYTRVALRWSRENMSLVRPPLEPGENLIRADVTVERGDGFRENTEESDARNPEVFDVDTSQQLTRTVIVDPAPQIGPLTATGTEDSIAVRYNWEDPYNEVEQIEISVDGGVRSSEPAADGIRDSISVNTPANTYGETVVRVRVIDGRGQTATASDTVTLPSRPQPRSSSPTRREGSLVFNEEEEQIETEGGQVLFKVLN